MNQLLENLSDAEILSLTLIGEARGEPIEGIIAVGCIIRNRMHHSPSKYHTYKDVCYEPKQFSCWNENDTNYPFLIDLASQLIAGQKLNDPYIRQCMWVANGIIDWSLIDNTSGSLYYLTNELFKSNLKPKWSLGAKNIKDIGRQTFFNV